jgi:hypothetical protein
MAAQSTAPEKSAPARDTFYVVKQCCLAATPATVTVLHQVPYGAEELAAFDYPNQAIAFAETIVLNERAIGSLVELVDPPYGLVGVG